MKIFLIASVIALPMAGFANTINFKCQSIDVQGIHKFDAQGIVHVDDVNNVEGVISINTQKAQSTQSVQTFEEVRVKGFIHHFEAIDVATNDFDHMVLTTSEAYLKSVNLLFGYPDKLASKVFSIDNFSFRSNCKITDRY
jgi:hypothetical protein